MNYHYLRIAERLRRDIFAGKIPARRRLPPERFLAEKFRVARPTLRQAMKLLENENLIQRRQGWGTSVNPVPSRRIPLMIDYTGSMRRYVSQLKRKVIFSKWVPAGAKIAAELQIQENDPVLYAERLDLLERKPIAYDRVYITVSFGKQLTFRDLARVDFIETWMSASHFEITVCRQSVDAVRAEKAIARYLKMPNDAPVLKSTEIYYARRNRPAGLYLSFYNPDVIRIVSVFRWPPPRKNEEK